MSNPRSFISYSPEDTKHIAEQIAQEVTNGQIIALQGELGAGKTTFVQYLLKALGISKKVTSPTFTIIKEYTTDSKRNIYHLDLYRLKTAEELDSLDINHIFIEPGAIVLIEWPELISHLLPQQSLFIEFQIDNQDNRHISIFRK